MIFLIKISRIPIEKCNTDCIRSRLILHVIFVVLRPRQIDPSLRELYDRFMFYVVEQIVVAVFFKRNGRFCVREKQCVRFPHEHVSLHY